MHLPPGPRGAAAGRRDHDKGCAQLVFPNLITSVATTDATVTDNQMTGTIHANLAAKNLAPGRHYLDSGYLSAALVVSALATWGIATGDTGQDPLLPPARLDPLADRHPPIVPPAFRKLDAIAVLAGPFLPAPRHRRVASQTR